MENKIEFYKYYKGNNPVRQSDTVKSSFAIDIVGKTSNWTKLRDLRAQVWFKSDGLGRDELRAPFRVLAKVSNEAAKIAGLRKGEGWYVTDIPTNSF